MLESLKDNNFYIGISRNPKHRLLLHNRGKTRSTKKRRPFTLVYVEEIGSLQEAREREKYYKSGYG
ncbi:GIY-YIG nuclease family protein, partial [candidate division WOR-3 bacterium]|nr:GIY-YIG nuclease family protein [candidate division WOR-3 bacterium]